MHGNLFQLLIAQAELSASQATELTGAAKWWAEWQPVVYGLLYVLAIFVLPFVAARIISNAIRLPAVATRMGTALAAVVASLLFVINGQLLLGPDMKGGTTLVYNIIETPGDEEINAAALASALSGRIDPSGTKEITIRPRGTNQIEITLPSTDEFELERIKSSITTAGQLEFRVVANTRDHEDIIRLATAQQADRRLDVINAEGKPVARWFTVGREEKTSQGVMPLLTEVSGDIIRNSDTGQIVNLPQLEGKPLEVEKWLDSQGIQSIDMLMALEFLGRPYAELYGDDLASAQTEFSKMGEPIVGFRFNSQGAGKMLELTTSIMPDGAFKRRMAIIMDKRVLSAPNVNSPIGDAGVIEGRFTKAEVDFLVTILRSGRLPATLEKQPASQNRVGAGLGEITIRKGTTTAIWSVIAILAFMLVYYQFSGVVASIALLLNGLLIFGIMIFIRQPLSLPGLAGLVLTVGMSVDANVLIYERIREEIAKGSAARLSIRNGFDRALTTIVDANLTTLIAAAVLYWIGTEQVRGFAVTLIIGIVVSMFTAIFCSRIIFEVAEKLKLVSLKMFDGVGFLKRAFFGQRDIDFMSMRTLCFVGSTILIVVGLVAAFFRGAGMLNIDFTGGTTVTIQLEQPVAIDDMRRITREILVDEEGKPLESTLVRVETDPADTVYTLVTSLADENDLAARLTAGLAKEKLTNLVTYKAKVTSLSAGGDSRWEGRSVKTRLVSMQAADQQASEAQSASSPPVAEEAQPVQQSDPEQPAAESAAPAESTPGSADTAPATPGGVQAEITAQPGDELAVAEPARVMSKFRLELSGLEEKDAAGNSRNLARRNTAKIKEDLVAAAQAAGVQLNTSLVILSPDPKPDNWREDSSEAFSNWEIQLPLAEPEGQRVMDQVASTIGSTPLWLSLSQIGGRVAGEMQQRALAALLVSLLFIVGYIWFRFQRISYGLAAVVALVHDVLITIGALALCHWLAKPLGFLLIEDFKIGLTEIAAFLTIIGYSLNDTIVVFDRIREIRGRSPRLTPEMLNQSINQTLSRTLLTSGTTLLTVFLLYAFGGDGIHAFSFALLIGIGIGTYSSVYIASPILLWLTNRELAAANK